MKFKIDRTLCREILRIAVPMILSMSGFTIMNFVDGIFLARHSPEAVAAAGTAGLAAWLLTSFFVGIVGFTSTVVAHYHGSKREFREGPANSMVFAYQRGNQRLLAGVGIWNKSVSGTVEWNGTRTTIKPCKSFAVKV